jgi:hypothetical protein
MEWSSSSTTQKSDRDVELCFAVVKVGTVYSGPPISLLP